MSGRLEEALARHRFDKAIGRCRCGWETSHRGNRSAEHRAHLSATVLALLDSPEVREVVAEALQAACDETWLTLTPGESGVEIDHGHDAAFALAALREWLGAES